MEWGRIKLVRPRGFKKYRETTELQDEIDEDNRYVEGNKIWDKYHSIRFTVDERREKIWQVLAEYLQKYIPEDSIVLDIGAGYCDFINCINAKEKHALDNFRWFVKYAKKGVVTHAQSCTNLENFESDYFDVVFASNLLEHLGEEDTNKTISEVRRVLKIGGRFIIMQPNFKYAYREYFDDYTHKHPLTHISLSELLKVHDFDIMHVVPRFLPYSLKSNLPPSPFLLKLYLWLPIKPFAKQMLIIAEKTKKGD